MNRVDGESVVMSADDVQEYNEYLDRQEREEQCENARERARIMCENRRTLSDLLAVRGIEISFPFCYDT